MSPRLDITVNPIRSRWIKNPAAMTLASMTAHKRAGKGTDSKTLSTPIRRRRSAAVHGRDELVKDRGGRVDDIKAALGVARDE